MGGNGGGVQRRTRTGGNGGSQDYCVSLRIETLLLSPMIAQVEKLHVGSVLKVDIIDKSDVTTVGVFTEDHILLGSISSSELSRLLRCIKEGHQYVADVLKVEGAECRVRIRHKTH